MDMGFNKFFKYSYWKITQVPYHQIAFFNQRYNTSAGWLVVLCKCPNEKLINLIAFMSRMLWILATAFCSPREWLPGNMVDNTCGKRRVVLSCNNTFPKPLNRLHVKSFPLCCNNTCSKSCFAKAVAPACRRSNTPCLLNRLPLNKLIWNAHSLKVLLPLRQPIIKPTTKWYALIFFDLRCTKPLCFPILVITDLSKKFSIFFYLAVEIAICRHCKMYLELQVAFSFYILTPSGFPPMWINP